MGLSSFNNCPDELAFELGFAEDTICTELNNLTAQFVQAFRARRAAGVYGYRSDGIQTETPLEILIGVVKDDIGHPLYWCDHRGNFFLKH